MDKTLVDAKRLGREPHHVKRIPKRVVAQIAQNFVAIRPGVLGYYALQSHCDVPLHSWFHAGQHAAFETVHFADKQFCKVVVSNLSGLGTYGHSGGKTAQRVVHLAHVQVRYP
jgi:hypothetical protein